MNHLQKTENPKGQAMAEMLICLPLLLLFAAGLFQFSVLFLSRVQFEHSCGEAARQYCAGLIDQNSLGPKVYENLGYFQRYFDAKSIQVSIQQPQSTVATDIDKVRNSIRFIPFTVDYDGYEWAVDIKCKPPFFFKTLFPEGINFHTIMQVYRYPV